MARLHPPQRRHIRCRKLLPKKMGILPLSSTGTTRVVRHDADTQGADVLEPSLHWGGGVVGADINLACPTQGLTAPPCSDRRNLVSAKAMVTDRDPA